MQMPTLSRRKLGVATGAAALLAMTALAACDPAPDGKVTQLTLAGSDTTQEVIGQIANQYNADAAYNTDGDVNQNILAQQTSAKNVPADDNCGSVTWHTPAGAGERLAPNGSGAGRDALLASVQAKDGCVDVARSSGAPRAVGTVAGTDLATFRYFAYALDAVAAAAGPNAPAGLTQAQLQDIYRCNITNWSAVGGANAAIVRYWPQAGSGTRSFAQSDLLGFDPTTVATCATAPKTTEENTGATIAANGDAANAVVPFSAGNWVAQARHTVGDVRNGLEILSLNGQNAVTGSGTSSQLNTAGPVKESNVRLVDPTPAYPGIRYVFNVLDSTSKSYSQAAYFYGFGTDDGSTFKSPLCDGSKASTLTSFGFGPLDTTVSDNNPAGSTCRLYQP